MTINNDLFAKELAAAGLAGLPFSWGADGSFQFAPSMTQEQRDAVLAVYEAHDPNGFIAPQPSAEEMAKRQRAQILEDLERQISLGASQAEINRQLLDLLKE